MRVRFGDCVLDSETRELTRGGRAVHVSPKAFRLLQVLIEKRPKAVSKETLHDLLWPKTFVSDAALTGLVKQVRAAIGDDARASRFIRTVAVFGYAFCGEAAEELQDRGSTEPVLWLIGAGHEVVLAKGENILGRGPESIISVDDNSVSRRHARIFVSGGSATVEDLRSKNGTHLRGRPITAAESLRDGDEIRLGDLILEVRFQIRPTTTETANRAKNQMGPATTSRRPVGRR